MSRPRIGIVISTTREQRFGERVSQWIKRIAEPRGDADYELVDLRDYPIPYFDAAMSPRFAPSAGEAAQLFARKMEELDGYVFVTAEYNHSIPAVLKNALDHVFHETARKPAAYVGYGAVGAARAIAHLRGIAVELGMASTRAAVHISMEPLIGMLREGKDFADYPYLEPTVAPMLDELLWWAETLRDGRVRAEVLKAA